MGCFHHVAVIDRIAFLIGVNRVLKRNGLYLLTCFSSKNAPAWNHFTKTQLITLFSKYFTSLALTEANNRPWKIVITPLDLPLEKS